MDHTIDPTPTISTDNTIEDLSSRWISLPIPPKISQFIVQNDVPRSDYILWTHGRELDYPMPDATS